MKVIIVEDEKYAVKRLKELVLQLEPSWEIIHVFDAIEESVHWLKNNPHPALIFMDIQLADGFSFEIFDKVKIESKVIFTTAFDNYAIEAFRHNGLDYLLKPIEKELLQESIERFKKTNTTKTFDLDSLSKLINPKKNDFKKRFLTKSGDQLNFIEVKDIAFFVSESSYSFVFSTAGNQYILDETMDQIEQHLNPSLFFRINRKQIVSINCIKSIKSYFNNRLILDLSPVFKDETIVSRTRVKEFKGWLNE